MRSIQLALALSALCVASSLAEVPSTQPAGPRWTAGSRSSPSAAAAPSTARAPRPRTPPVCGAFVWCPDGGASGVRCVRLRVYGTLVFDVPVWFLYAHVCGMRAVRWAHTATPA